MLKQTDIFKSVISKLNTLKLTIYTDEVAENYKTPCLFVKLIKVFSAQTKNVNSNNLTIIVTYMFSKYESQQIQKLNFEDNIIDLFGHGLQINDRFLHTDNISYDMIGEDNDILQATIDITYIDSNDYDNNYDYDNNTEYELANKVNVKMDY